MVADMNNLILTEVLDTALDIQKAYDFVANSANGAVNSFVGIVRNNHEGKSVTGLTYDLHTTLAKKAFDDICQKALELWPETKYYVAHYHGELSVGGISIIIAVSSPHRAESFEACRYIIEEIKTKAPVWKQEHYIDRKSEWLPGHSLNG